MLAKRPLSSAPISSPGGLFDDGSISLTDSVGVNDTPVNFIAALIAEAFATSDTPATFLHALNALLERAGINDIMHAALSAVLADQLAFNETPVGTLRALEQMADAMVASGVVTSIQHAFDAIAEAIALDDFLQRVFDSTLSEGLGIDDAIAHAAAVSNALTDQTAYDDFLVNSLRVTAAIQDTVASNDTPITVLRAINSIADGLDVFATLTIDGDTFSGHVLNTETRYATEYANYPFNSFAEFNGKLYGASQYGLFELTGDTDDGTAIEAYFKTGLMKLADGKLARVPSCYLGYTSDGTLVLKATVTSEKGEKQEYWYELRQQTAEVMREGRIKLGRGLQSVYWQFELHNVKGSDFHFDTIEFFPMILDRRIRK